MTDGGALPDLLAAVLPREVVRLLPASYVTTLECVAHGHSDQVVSERLGVDPTAVPALVRLATAKFLAALSLLAYDASH